MDRNWREKVMKKLILASNNAKKIKELKNMLEGLDFIVCSLKDENINIEVVEDGSTFEENAYKKSYEIYKFLKARDEKDFYVLSDDSGLEVEYLNGAPGIYSARYSGVHGNDYENNIKLLNDMKEAKETRDRVARFVCVLALIDENGHKKIVEGYVEGVIVNELKESGGFGYDPLFYYEPLKKTFGEATSEEKNDVSHRGQALKKLKEILSEVPNL